jgi:hypothetical protein
MKGFISLWIVATFAAHWKGILAIILIVYGLVAFCRASSMLAKQRRFTRQRRLEVEAWRNAELSWRAEYENDMAYRGDDRGFYGEYPPTTMPMTNPYLYGGWK